MWLTDQGGNFAFFPNINVFVAMMSQLGVRQKMLGTIEMNLNWSVKNIALEVAGKHAPKGDQLGKIVAVGVGARNRRDRVLQFNHVAHAQISEPVLPRTQVIVGGD